MLYKLVLEPSADVFVAKLHAFKQVCVRVCIHDIKINKSHISRQYYGIHWKYMFIIFVLCNYVPYFIFATCVCLIYMLIHLRAFSDNNYSLEIELLLEPEEWSILQQNSAPNLEKISTVSILKYP